MNNKQKENDSRKKNPTPGEKLASEIKDMRFSAIIVQVLGAPLIVLVIISIIQWITGGGEKEDLYAVLVAGFCLAVPPEILFAACIAKLRKLKAQKREEDKNPTPQIVFADPLYKNKGYTYDIAFEHYCKQYDKKKLTKEEQQTVWEYSYDDFAYLLMWIIENGLYQPTKELDEDEAHDMKAYVAKIKKRTVKPTEYLIDNDGYFMEDEVKKKARNFVKNYYEGAYENEVVSFAKDRLNSEIYGFPFRWEDYDEFKSRIDEAYQNYLGEQ